MGMSVSDDGRCNDKSAGVYESLSSCSEFFVCDSDGGFVSVGVCPCDKIFHSPTSTCERQTNHYYQNPLECMQFYRCMVVGAVVVRNQFLCQAGYGFNIYIPRPMCKLRKEVPGC